MRTPVQMTRAYIRSNFVLLRRTMPTTSRFSCTDKKQIIMLDAGLHCRNRTMNRNRIDWRLILLKEIWVDAVQVIAVSSPLGGGADHRLFNIPETTLIKLISPRIKSMSTGSEDPGIFIQLWPGPYAVTDQHWQWHNRQTVLPLHLFNY